MAVGSEVILLANRGVGSSTGAVPDNVMARDTLLFVGALALKQIDLLGFSLAGYVAQEKPGAHSRATRALARAPTDATGRRQRDRRASTRPRSPQS